MRVLLPALFAAVLGMFPGVPVIAADEAAADAAATTSDVDAEVLAAARAADLFYQRKIDRLTALLRSPIEAERVEALSHIGHLRDPAMVPTLLPWLQASNRTPAELIAASCAVPTDGGQAAIPALKNLLKNDDAGVRVAAMNALTRLQSIASADYMARSADKEPAIRASSATNLGVLAVTDAGPILLKHLALDGKPHVRRMCAISLGLLGDRTHGPALADALTDSNPGVRRYAAEALVKINYTPAIPNLLMAMEGNVAGDHIARCLTLMTMQDFGFSSRANPLARTEAIEKGFAWWTANAKDLNH
ncbi:MAG: HEAT repeat domain-containing protein [Planctomycetes bacterium]|nr:HEAT repeat domain-containing protein [Planctomycetota bacterium]